MKYKRAHVSNFSLLSSAGKIAGNGMNALNALATPLMIGSMVIPSADMRLQEKLQKEEAKKQAQMNPSQSQKIKTTQASQSNLVAPDAKVTNFN